MPKYEIETIPRDESKNLERPVRGIYYYAVAYGRTTGVLRDWKYVFSPSIFFFFFFFFNLVFMQWWRS